MIIHAVGVFYYNNYEETSYSSVNTYYFDIDVYQLGGASSVIFMI
jgi:hypothetical protein